MDTKGLSIEVKMPTTINKSGLELYLGCFFTILKGRSRFVVLNNIIVEGK